MINLRDLIGKYSQFLKFCVVGLFNTLISVVVFNIVTFMGLHYLPATIIGYLAGLVNGYISSSKYVFKKNTGTDTAIKFVGVYLSALIINLGLMYLMVDVGNINSSLGQLVTTGFNVVYNFILNKIWTFRGK
ncbi:MAG: GtrA family protein [Filifactoraceae bacterium]